MGFQADPQPATEDKKPLQRRARGAPPIRHACLRMVKNKRPGRQLPSAALQALKKNRTVLQEPARLRLLGQAGSQSGLELVGATRKPAVERAAHAAVAGAVQQPLVNQCDGYKRPAQPASTGQNPQPTPFLKTHIPRARNKAARAARTKCSPVKLSLGAQFQSTGARPQALITKQRRCPATPPPLKPRVPQTRERRRQRLLQRLQGPPCIYLNMTVCSPRALAEAKPQQGNLQGLTTADRSSRARGAAARSRSLMLRG